MFKNLIFQEFNNRKPILNRINNILLIINKIFYAIWLYYKNISKISDLFIFKGYL